MKEKLQWLKKEPMLTLSALAALAGLLITPPSTALLGQIDWRTLGTLLMILAAFFMIFGGTVLGLRFASVSLPIFSCPVNTEQMTESSCYYLSHLSDLFEMPPKDILLFFGTTVGFALILFSLCGLSCFLVPITSLRRSDLVGVSSRPFSLIGSLCLSRSLGHSLPSCTYCAL